MLSVGSYLASRHARLARRVTRSNRWVAIPARVVEVPYSAGLGQRSQYLLAIRGLDDRSILVQPVGMRRLNPTFQPVVWTAGVADRRFVVSPPGGGRVLCVEEVRTKRSERRGQRGRSRRAADSVTRTLPAWTSCRPGPEVELPWTPIPTTGATRCEPAPHD